MTQTGPAPRLRVAAFTAGAAVPAARFRVRQYVTPLAGHGIALREYWPRLGAYPPQNRLLRPAWLVGTLAERLPQLAAAAASAEIVLRPRGAAPGGARRPDRRRQRLAGGNLAAMGAGRRDPADRHRHRALCRIAI